MCPLSCKVGSVESVGRQFNRVNRPLGYAPVGSVSECSLDTTVVPRPAGDTEAHLRPGKGRPDQRTR